MRNKKDGVLTFLHRTYLLESEGRSLIYVKPDWMHYHESTWLLLRAHRWYGLHHTTPLGHTQTAEEVKYEPIVLEYKLVPPPSAVYKFGEE